MEAVVHLDTHVVVWLYSGLLEHIPKAVQDTVEAHELFVSPMVALELQYLHEIKRLKVGADAILTDLRARIGVAQTTTALSKIVSISLRLKWTRDPFDRLIAGNAIAEDAVLLTADEVIRKHCKHARWG